MRTWMLALAMAAVQPLAIRAEQPQPTPDQISGWVEDLDSDQYLAREVATRRLQEVGAIAFDGLLAAAQGDRPEAVYRGIWILSQAAYSEDHDLQHEAQLRLAKLEHRPEVSVPANVALIERDGARLLPQGQDEVGRWMHPRIEIDRNWRGGDDGLARVAAVHGITTVWIRNAPVTPAGIAHLRSMPTLERLFICGIAIDAEQRTALEADFSHLQSFDFRRGALLGVQGRPGATAAIVQAVVSGSAAEKAGIRTGDMIVKLNDQQVETFQQLTELIGQLPAGDEAKLQVQRGDQKLTKLVKFGSW